MSLHTPQSVLDGLDEIIDYLLENEENNYLAIELAYQLRDEVARNLPEEDEADE